jgi:predicted nuclease with TOPRIM domain
MQSVTEDQIRKRLAELTSELQTGNQRLQELEREETQLREVMLRISGAIQVLEELLSETVPEQVPAPPRVVPDDGAEGASDQIDTERGAAARR